MSIKLFTEKEIALLSNNRNYSVASIQTAFSGMPSKAN
jgi:hypothetical protein